MVNKQKILIVDDDEAIAELVSLYLAKECFDTMMVHDGEKALVAFDTYHPNLVLLDLMLPGIDGYQVCREIRARANTPIIMLSAKGEVFDKVLGLELGADDYILKPFSLRVLLAKCQAVLERYQRGQKYEVQKGLVLNEERQQFFCDGKPVELQSLDYRLLSYFFKNPNRILTREQIILKLWGYEYTGNDRAVDTHVKNVRKALGDYGSCIRTIVKKGYIFEANMIQ